MVGEKDISLQTSLEESSME
ncbi:hypothetical protein CCACVL1_05213 [Corchorus capsularis]|uniref:Uncharacterized protein n=1 Tax=Corchorus capsularis TaxID=210143 RepID=A0A1R3JLY1_COCAP|nr:hypothetical protein CCACVL1_05213 [Corchorus capsularis]